MLNSVMIGEFFFSLRFSLVIWINMMILSNHHWNLLTTLARFGILIGKGKMKNILKRKFKSGHHAYFASCLLQLAQCITNFYLFIFHLIQPYPVQPIKPIEPCPEGLTSSIFSLVFKTLLCSQHNQLPEELYFIIRLW